jgi:hypothetical protein
VIRFPGKGGLQKVEIHPCPTYRSTGQDSCRRPAKIIVAEQQELAEIEDENAPTLVMAIEKPELYQHPPQAIHEFVVEDMPVTVAVDTQGESIHQTAPKIWQQKIGKIPVIEAS